MPILHAFKSAAELGVPLKESIGDALVKNEEANEKLQEFRFFESRLAEHVNADDCELKAVKSLGQTIAAATSISSTLRSAARLWDGPVPRRSGTESRTARSRL